MTRKLGLEFKPPSSLIVTHGNILLEILKGLAASLLTGVPSMVPDTTQASLTVPQELTPVRFIPLSIFLMKSWNLNNVMGFEEFLAALIMSPLDRLRGSRLRSTYQQPVRESGRGFTRVFLAMRLDGPEPIVVGQHRQTNRTNRTRPTTLSSR